ncbi:hypothetical protein [Kushneria avicenniae]|uniref:hypothetical protein n=1 Tax=Kushneria avicenniae TaxID=402385 RepID=UPI000B7F38AC|nr:hypothetical protein [Kushneria avicenniae]
METTIQDAAAGLGQALEGENWLGRVAIPADRAEVLAAITMVVRRRTLSMSVLIGTGFLYRFCFRRRLCRSRPAVFIWWPWDCWCF